MAPRSVIDLLVEQPEEALVGMLETVDAELARLTVERRQIEQALAKKSRSRGKTGGRLTREQVFDVVKRADEPPTASEVHALLAAEGVTASPNSVRNHLARLVDDNGWLVRTADGRYILSLAAGQPTDNSVPF